ncbi:MAG: hypothetical protein IPK33_09140 [Gemmatimonadetes bacterium]|nr:hypothetical protein [Gemmatimonadota bacterium]
MSRAAIRAAVDRTLGTVPSVTDGTAPVVAGRDGGAGGDLDADLLASRTREALVASGVGISELGVPPRVATPSAVRLPLAAAEQVRGRRRVDRRTIQLARRGAMMHGTAAPDSRATITETERAAALERA